MKNYWLISDFSLALFIMSIKSKYTFNDTKFSSPTLESSYWGGFLCASGNFVTTDAGNKILTVTLGIKNKPRLEKLLSFFESDHPINSDNKLYVNFSAVANKSYKNLHDIYGFRLPKREYNFGAVNLTNDQKIAFIIGYIDGSGSICMDNSKKVLISVTGGKKLLTFITNEISKYSKHSFTYSYIHKSGKCFSKVYGIRFFMGIFYKMLDIFPEIPYNVEKWLICWNKFEKAIDREIKVNIVLNELKNISVSDTAKKLDLPYQDVQNIKIARNTSYINFDAIKKGNISGEPILP